jgi:PPM family protein phosphatase
MILTLTHGAQSDVGRKRPHNEDCFCAEPALGLFVVCDGMGGGNAGEVASSLAVDTIRRHFEETARQPLHSADQNLDNRFSSTTNRLASAIRLANHLIYQSAGDRPGWNGMGTTVVAAALTGSLLSYAHVGDSRLYLVRNQTIQPLTIDHSWVAEQVRQGLLTEEEADRSPRRNIVTRALGTAVTVEATLGEVPLLPDDLLLLCSDGLTKSLPTATICDTLLDVEDAQTISHRLIDLANEAGGEDNITVIVLSVREQQALGLWHRLRKRLAT